MQGDGPLNGALILSSAPTKQDIDSGRAFGSKSGTMLRRWAAETGLDPVRFEYVLQEPVEQDLDKNPLYRHNSDILERIKCIRPRVIVACGEFALRAVTDYFDKVEDIHCYVLRDSLSVAAPVIPTFAPRQVMERPTNAYWMKFAIQKAAEVMRGRTDKPVHILSDNNYDRARTYIDEASRAFEVSIDIETIKGKPQLTAIGISYSPDSALSVSPGDGLSQEQFNDLVGRICAIIEDPKVMKIGQNFMFDCMMLWKIRGLAPQGLVWDTLHAANIRNCEIEKSLKALGRLYFYGEPWKGHWNLTGEKLRIYNAQDCAFTFRVMNAQHADLKKLELLNYYFDVPQRLFIPAFNLSTKGIRLDTAARAQMITDLEAALVPFAEKAAAIAKPFLPPAESKRNKRNPIADERIRMEGLDLGPEPTKLKTAALRTRLEQHIPAVEAKELYVAKAKDAKFGLQPGELYRKAYRTEVTLSAALFNEKSPKQLLGTLKNMGVKIPKVKKSNSDDWGESTNDKALAAIIERNTDPQYVIEFAQYVRFMRHGNKLMSSYLKAPIDEDNRWRTTYNAEGTETGRSSTKKTPWNTGGNNQNIPRAEFAGIGFKKLFVADQNMVLFQADQEQAEARVVAYLSGCKKLIELFEEHSDVHTYAISAILGEDISALKETDPKRFKELRQYGKIVNHGGNYDMGPSTLSENGIKDGIIISPKQAKFFLDRRREVFPEVYAWHKEIQDELHRTRTLFTPFGRRRFFMGVLDPAVYREAYAFIPQSTIPHITNQMWLWTTGRNMGIEVLQQGHDSLLCQLRPEELSSFASAFMAHSRELTITIANRTIFIPWDAASGTSWGDLKSLTKGA